MGTLTVTAKGQVTLKQDVLKHLGVRPGDRITVDMLPHGRIEVRAERPTGNIVDVFGMLKQVDGPHLTIDEMNDIIARGWAGEFSG